MPFRVHEVVSYSYSFSSSDGEVASLQLWNAQTEVLRIAFVADGEPVPCPTLGRDLECATALFRRSALPGLIDMLRNEKPVKVTINDQPPGFVFVHTGREPIGEGER